MHLSKTMNLKLEKLVIFNLGNLGVQFAIPSWLEYLITISMQFSFREMREK